MAVLSIYTEIATGSTTNWISELLVGPQEPVSYSCLWNTFIIGLKPGLNGIRFRGYALSSRRSTPIFNEMVPNILARCLERVMRRN
jgi:hypothetical protein